MNFVKILNFFHKNYILKCIKNPLINFEKGEFLNLKDEHSTMSNYCPNQNT